jgi:O-antigen/teichoic acid export membrane protein
LEAAGLWPHSIGIFLLFTYDRIYVVSSFGLHEGAIWGFANQMAAILFLFLDGLNKLYAPWLFKSLSSDSEIDRFNINRLTLLIIFLIILFSLGSYFLSDLLIFFIDTKYITSFNILKIMLLTQILSALYYYYVNFIFFKGENKLISIITIISATLYLLLLPFVKTTYGLEGIAWLSLLISLLRIFSLGYTAHIFYPWLSIFQTNKLHESK